MPINSELYSGDIELTLAISEGAFICKVVEPRGHSRPTDLTVQGSSAVLGEIFPTVHEVALHTTFHYHQTTVLNKLEILEETSYYSYARPAQPGPNRTRLCGSCIAAISGDKVRFRSDSVIKLVSVLSVNVLPRG